MSWHYPSSSVTPQQHTQRMFHTRYWSKLSQVNRQKEKRSKAPLRDQLGKLNKAPVSFQWLQRKPGEIKLSRLKLAFVNTPYSLILLPWLHKHTNASRINTGWIHLKFILKIPASSMKTCAFSSAHVNKTKNALGAADCRRSTWGKYWSTESRYLLGTSRRVFSPPLAQDKCQERIWGIHVQCANSPCNHIYLTIASFSHICIKIFLINAFRKFHDTNNHSDFLC